jgi:nucleoside-diphosphate-sugar epimerase
MRALVTGGAGHIGAAITARLVTGGYAVTTARRRR